MARNLGYQSLGRGASPLQQALQFAQIFKMMKPDESYPVTMPDGTTVNMSASEYSTWVRGLQSQDIQEQGLAFEGRRVGLEEKRVGLAEKQSGFESIRVGLEKERVELAKEKKALEERRVVAQETRVGFEEKRLAHEIDRIALEERRVKFLEKDDRTMTVIVDGEEIPVTPEGYRDHRFDLAKEKRAADLQTARLKTTIAKIGGEDVPMSPDAYADYMYQKSIEDPKHKIEISGQEVELDAGQYATYLINQAASDRAQKEQTERLKRYTVNEIGRAHV